MRERGKKRTRFFNKKLRKKFIYNTKYWALYWDSQGAMPLEWVWAEPSVNLLSSLICVVRKQTLAREVDFALLIDFDDLDEYLVAERNDVFDLFDAVVVQL